jgi:hypothetical protein
MRTIEQLRGWASMLIEIQMQRVMMLRAGEEMQGGAPDAAPSQELDRMSRLQLQFKELFEDGFMLSLQVKGHGASGLGVMSHFFGARATRRRRGRDQPLRPGCRVMPLRPLGRRPRGPRGPGRLNGARYGSP